jgi:hypothetical protein
MQACSSRPLGAEALGPGVELRHDISQGADKAAQEAVRKNLRRDQVIGTAAEFGESAETEAETSVFMEAG